MLIRPVAFHHWEVRGTNVVFHILSFIVSVRLDQQVVRLEVEANRCRSRRKGSAFWSFNDGPYQACDVFPAASTEAGGKALKNVTVFVPVQKSLPH